MKKLVKSITGEKDDELIDTYYKLAEMNVLNKLYPFGYEDDTEVPIRYHSVVVEIAVYFINKIGKEGVVSYSENGMQGTYENGDIPPSILNKVIPCGQAVK